MKPEHIASFQNKLLSWYEKNARDLPWRRTRDPYAIWVSEIMLQQTRVAAVIPYYERFLQKFPTLQALAEAKEEEVLGVWAGLGYYSRVRNLQAGAKEVMARYGGKVPDDPATIRKLPGIGAYTAGAILSIAYNKDEPVLDGNVARVLCRVYGRKGDPRETRLSRELWELARALVPKGRAGTMNQALMELGARLCSPKNPACLACPVRDLCEGGRVGAPESFGARAKKKPPPRALASGVLCWVGNSYLLARRPSGGLLGGLWELPSHLESEAAKGKEAAEKALVEGLGARPEFLSNAPVASVEHLFTHLHLTLSIYTARASRAPKGGSYPEFVLVEAGTLPQKPLPAVTKKALLVLKKKGLLGG